MIRRADSVQPKHVHLEPQSRQSGHKLRCLVWVGQYAVDWEILAYYVEGSWEACFFDRGSHHEHTNALSFEDVRRKAEQRIDSIEKGRLSLVPSLPLPERVSNSPRLLVLPKTKRVPEFKNHDTQQTQSTTVNRSQNTGG